MLICVECGKKYGKYSVGCSSVWIDKCDWCGETVGVTESRDWRYPKLPDKKINES